MGRKGGHGAGQLGAGSIVLPSANGRKHAPTYILVQPTRTQWSQHPAGVLPRAGRGDLEARTRVSRAALQCLCTGHHSVV